MVKLSQCERQDFNNLLVSALCTDGLYLVFPSALFLHLPTHMYIGSVVFFILKIQNKQNNKRSKQQQNAHMQKTLLIQIVFISFVL